MTRERKIRFSNSSRLVEITLEKREANRSVYTLLEEESEVIRGALLTIYEMF